MQYKCTKTHFKCINLHLHCSFRKSSVFAGLNAIKSVALCSSNNPITMQEIVNYITKQTGISLDETQQRQLADYCDFLLEENQKYNLTAITEIPAVWKKHFADSILGSVLLPPNATVCDVGSGAGFPSLPLKIARTDLSVTLVDSLQKRINFTQELCKRLGLSAEFFHSRAEDFAKAHREQYDVAVARAVAPLPILLEYTAPVVNVGGKIVAYKTDASELDSSQNAMKVLHLVPEEFVNFILPDGSRRCLLSFVKKAPTPHTYPRGQNKPRKSPL